MNFHPDRKFYVIGKECEPFEDMVKGKWFDTEDNAKIYAPSQSTLGIYEITVKPRLYRIPKIDAEWIEVK